LLSVTDNGIGIPQDQLDNVFVVFRRLHSPDEFPGSGIGLTICRKIASLHGATIRAIASAEGAHIQLSLPLRPVRPAVSIKRPAVPDTQ
jgi:signal transduction histidine kinase